MKIEWAAEMEGLSSVEAVPVKKTRTITFECTRSRPGAYWKPGEAACAKLECDPSLLPTGSLARFLADNVQTTCHWGGNLISVLKWVDNDEIPAPYRTKEGGRWDSFKWSFGQITETGTPEGFFEDTARRMIDKGVEWVCFRPCVGGEAVEWHKN